MANENLPRKRKLTNPPNKIIIADEATEKKILFRQEPEFKDKIAIVGENGEVVLKSDELFMCEEPGCKALFTNAERLGRHKRRHFDPKIKCKYCSVSFKSEADRTEHLEEFHFNIDEDPEANVLQCKKCKKIMMSAFKLSRHIRRTHQKRNYPCSQCEATYTQLEGLQQHLKRYHLNEGEEKPTYPCELCDQVYAYSPDLRRHILRVHRGKSQKLINCVICNVTYPQNSYRNHMLQHTKPKSYSCEVCNVQFRILSRLRQHLESTKHKENVKVYQRRRNSRRKVNQGKIPDIRFDLTTVFHETKTLAELRQMTTEKLINFCNKRIPKIVLFKVDAEVVRRGKSSRANNKRNASDSEEDTLEEKNGKEDSKNYYLKCVYCTKEFSNLEEVSSHEKACYKEIRYGAEACFGKKFQCKVPGCNKEFARRHQFLSHSIVHSNERPYKCNYCEKSFKQKCVRLKHEKTVHFGLNDDRKPEKDFIYACPHEGCKNRYALKKNLVRHIGRGHLGIDFPCSKCNRVFSRKDYRAIHEQKEHAEQPQFLAECKPCNKIFKHKTLYLQHAKGVRHIRKLKAFEMENLKPKRERKKSTK